MNLIAWSTIYLVSAFLQPQQNCIRTTFPLCSLSTSSPNNENLDLKTLLYREINDPTLAPSEPNRSLSPVVMNQGKTASFMLAWPSITTFTLVKGWNHETTKQLKHSVQNVIRRNPVLGGRATMSSFFRTRISVTPIEEEMIGQQDFVHEINLSDDVLDLISSMNLQSMNETEVLQFMDDFLVPIVPKPLSVIESIQTGSPLFRMDVIQLPNDVACYIMTMSHCIGDGVTYYNVMDEIRREMKENSHQGKEIVWSHSDIANHEIFPKHFSKRDIEFAYGGPFFLGLLKNVFNMDKQQKSYIILDKHRIAQKKKKLTSDGQGHLSDNDIITAALCQANGSSDIFAFAMNMRDRHCHYGGNFHNEVPFAKEHALEPRDFRNIVKRGYDFDTNKIPLCPYIFGRSGRISSLASIQKLIETNETDCVICHAMLSHFVQNVPMDTAFIISMNSKSYVVLHNFRDINMETELIKEILS